MYWYIRAIRLTCTKPTHNIHPLAGSYKSESLTWFLQPFVDRQSLHERTNQRTSEPTDKRTSFYCHVLDTTTTSMGGQQ